MSILSHPNPSWLSPPRPAPQPIGITGTLLAAHRLLTLARGQVIAGREDGITAHCDAHRAEVVVSLCYGTQDARLALLNAAAEIMHTELRTSVEGFAQVVGEWAEVPVSIETAYGSAVAS